MNTHETFCQPKYATVIHELRERIRGGDLLPGDRLPTFADMKTCGISQPPLDRMHSFFGSSCFGGGVIKNEKKAGGKC